MYIISTKKAHRHHDALLSAFRPYVKNAAKAAAPAIYSTTSILCQPLVVDLGVLVGRDRQSRQIVIF